MRALDGTYWRVYWKPNPTECVRITAIVHHNFPDKGDAKDFMREIAHTSKAVLIVRIRPRMSIVKAVRLLTEARAKGVELWMTSADRAWLSISDGSLWVIGDNLGGKYDRTTFGHWFNDRDVLRRWIVATPEDARRIDARRGS